jgi:hypothetical protein
MANSLSLSRYTRLWRKLDHDVLALQEHTTLSRAGCVPPARNERNAPRRASASVRLRLGAPPNCSCRRSFCRGITLSVDLISINHRLLLSGFHCNRPADRTCQGREGGSYEPRFQVAPPDSVTKHQVGMRALGFSEATPRGLVTESSTCSLDLDCELSARYRRVKPDFWNDTRRREWLSVIFSSIYHCATKYHGTGKQPKASLCHSTDSSQLGISLVGGGFPWARSVCDRFQK